MNLIYRSAALLAFSFALVQFAQAQTRISAVSQLGNQSHAAEEVNVPYTEPSSVTPVLDVYQNPGERSIHLHLSGLQGSSNLSITVIAPNSRQIRNRSVHLCTLCGTFDIDLEDEVSTGRHVVLVDYNGMAFSRTVWVE